jgi:WD40 repeat protein
MTDAVYWVGTLEDPRRYRITATDASNAMVGGEGLVYRATDRFGAVVALKMLTTIGPGDVTRVTDRLSPFTEIRHRNLLAHREVFVGSPLVADSGTATDFDLLYTVADWIDGDSLTEVSERLTPRERIDVLGDIAAGVQTMHDARSAGSPAGLIHRDLKPSNIRIDTDGRAVIIDFGIARPISDDDMTSGAGTYRWKAPEVLRGAPTIGAPADIWGVGAIGYWLFVGEALTLDGAGPARERLRATDGIASLPQPARTATVISRLLESDPDKRPRDLTAWAQTLRHAQRRPWARRGAYGAVAATALVVAGTTAAQITSTDTAPTTTAVTSEATSPTTGSAVTPTGPITPIELTAEEFPPTVRADNWNEAAISADGAYIAGVDTNANLYAWRTETFEKIPLQNVPKRTPRRFTDGRERDVSLDFSVDGRFLVWTDGASITTIWNTRTGELVNSFETYGYSFGGGDLDGTSLTADGRHLVRQDSQEITIWSVATGRVAKVIDIPGGNIWRVNVSSSMRHLISRHAGRIELIDLNTLQTVTSRAATDMPLIAVDGTGRQWAYATTDAVMLVDIATGAETRVNIRPFLSIAPAFLMVYSPDGTRLAVPTEAEGVRIVDTASGEVLGQRAVAGALTSGAILTFGETGLFPRRIAFQPGGTLLATPIDTPGDTVLALLDTGPGGDGLLAPLVGHNAKVNLVTFSPDGRLLASASGDGTIRIWDVAARQTRYVLSGHLDGVSQMAFTPDSRYLVETKGRSQTTDLLRWALPDTPG